MRENIKKETIFSQDEFSVMRYRGITSIGGKFENFEVLYKDNFVIGEFNNHNESGLLVTESEQRAIELCKDCIRIHVEGV